MNSLDIIDYFDYELQGDYVFQQFIEDMYFDSTEASVIVMTSRLSKAFKNKKLTPTSRAFLIYLKTKACTERKDNNISYTNLKNK